MRPAAVLLSVFLVVNVYVGLASSPETDHLFWIERNKNKNRVQYDVRLLPNRDLPDSDPVVAYWVLEDGRREELSLLQDRYAYGIVAQERLGKNRIRFALAALKEREIIVEKMGEDYRAIISIDEKQIILEKIYVMAGENSIGFPKVSYVDIIGRTLQTNQPVKERITSD